MTKRVGDPSGQLKKRLQRIVKKPKAVLTAEIAVVFAVILIVGLLLLVSTRQETEASQGQEPVKVEKIQITAMPYRCVYISDQQLDTAGMELTLTYADGTTEKVTEGFTCKPQVLSGSGSQTVTVTYGAKTASFKASVVKAVRRGSCGENLLWNLTAAGELIITGSGRMNDYTQDDVPWVRSRDMIETVYLPEGLQHIGENAFACCYDLEEIRIPEAVSSIGKSAFYQCINLQRCSIPGKVRDIEQYTFYDCYTLQEVVLPQGLRYIGEMAFGNCFGLRYIALPNSLTTIGGSAFHSSGLQRITIPEGVTHIPENVFRSCTSLRSVNLPTSLVSIGRGVFYCCTNLKSLHIPAGVSKLDPWMFRNSGIQDFTVDPKNPYYISDTFGVVYTKDFEKLVMYPSAQGGIYHVAAGCKVIGEYAFKESNYLYQVVLPASLQCIEAYAFYNCEKLNQVTIPESVKEVKLGCFSYCQNLQRVYIMNPACTIEQMMFDAGRRVVIYCHADSGVQKQAQQYGYAYAFLQE